MPDELLRRYSARQLEEAFAMLRLEREAQDT